MLCISLYSFVANVMCICVFVCIAANAKTEVIEEVDADEVIQRLKVSFGGWWDIQYCIVFISSSKKIVGTYVCTCVYCRSNSTDYSMLQSFISAMIEGLLFFRFLVLYIT